jgi:hypothetical protein
MLKRWQPHSGSGSWNLLLPCSVGLGLSALLIARIALSDSRRFAAQATQVVKLRSAHTTSLYNVYMIYNRGVQWKDSLNPNTKTRLPHSYCLARAAVFARNHHAFKGLQAFFGF